MHSLILSDSPLIISSFLCFSSISLQHISFSLLKLTSPFLSLISFSLLFHYFAIIFFNFSFSISVIEELSFGMSYRTYRNILYIVQYMFKVCSISDFITILTNSNSFLFYYIALIIHWWNSYVFICNFIVYLVCLSLDLHVNSYFDVIFGYFYPVIIFAIQQY